MLNIKEVNVLLDKLVLLRKSGNSKKELLEYNKYLNYCAEQLDYLVESKAKRYINFSNYEDLLQEGRIALIMSLKTYDNEKGSFFSWSKQYIKTRLSRQANKHSVIQIPIKQTKKFKPYKVSNLSRNGAARAVTYDPTPYEEVSSRQTRDIVSAAINKLPPDEKTIMELSGVKLYSITEISEMLNTPRRNCIKLLNKARQNLKITLGENDAI